MKTFEFYLDAWNYCQQHSIPIERIVRKSFRSWTINKGVKK